MTTTPSKTEVIDQPAADTIQLDRRHAQVVRDFMHKCTPRVDAEVRAIIAIDDALKGAASRASPSQPAESKPVAWRRKHRNGSGYALFDHDPSEAHDNGVPSEPLYLLPVSQPAERADLAELRRLLTGMPLPLVMNAGVNSRIFNVLGSGNETIAETYTRRSADIIVAACNAIPGLIAEVEESRIADEATAAMAADYERTIASLRAEIARLQGLSAAGAEGRYTLDTPEMVCFYEQEFYVLSNFSSFRVTLQTANGELEPEHGPVHDADFDTSEHAYHFFKFPGEAGVPIRSAIRRARSAHEAFKIAEKHRAARRADWDDVKVGIMRKILRAKVHQHEYVRRKLLASGTRTLVENSWRDDYWGWGRKRDGQNMLGRLWMEVRDELRVLTDFASALPDSTPPQQEGAEGKCMCNLKGLPICGKRFSGSISNPLSCRNKAGGGAAKCGHSIVCHAAEVKP